MQARVLQNSESTELTIKNKSSPESNVSDDSSSSSADISLDNLSSPSASSSDDPSTESPALHISSDETEDDPYANGMGGCNYRYTS